jgi:hypothetical protein
MSGTWTLFVTDALGVRQAQIDTYQKCELYARANAVSTWALDLPSNTEAGRFFIATTTARLEVRLDETIWRSGPMTSLKRTVDMDGDMLELAGVDDAVWLARRLAHPQPGSAAPPYSTTAYDIHTGSLTTVLRDLVNVNAGPGATPIRQVPGLVVPTVVAAGPTVTVNARWQNLLTLMADNARAGGVVFDVVNLTFHAVIPVDHGVIFSEGLETLGAWRSTLPAPSANTAFVAGGGEGTARIIREAQDAASVTAWGRVETFVDRRDTTDIAQLDQAAAEALALGVTPTTVVFTPLDTPAQSFGTDWVLGDTVTVRAGDLTIVDQIREVHVLLDGFVPTITPSVGAPSGDLGLFRSLAGLDRRVRQLERV